MSSRGPRWHVKNDTAARDVCLDPGRVVRPVRGGTDGRNTESGTATVAGGILMMRERRPNRAPRFDYSSRGAYFITTNVKHRAEWFGRLRDGRMVLNADGLIAHRCWMEIPEHFPGVRVDAFVVMPDHVHGILVIDDVPSVENVVVVDASVGDAYMRPLQRRPQRRHSPRMAHHQLPISHAHGPASRQTRPPSRRENVPGSPSSTGAR